MITGVITYGYIYNDIFWANNVSPGELSPSSVFTQIYTGCLLKSVFWVMDDPRHFCIQPAHLLAFPWIWALFPFNTKSPGKLVWSCCFWTLFEKCSYHFGKSSREDKRSTIISIHNFYMKHEIGICTDKQLWQRQEEHYRETPSWFIYCEPLHWRPDNNFRPNAF